MNNPFLYPTKKSFQVHMAIGFNSLSTFRLVFFLGNLKKEFFQSNSMLLHLDNSCLVISNGIVPACKDSPCKSILSSST